jgi:hypothetical protein
MSAMDPQRDTAGSQGEGVESVKVEKNTKGKNYSFRIIREDGETWKELLRRAREVDAELEATYGGVNG